MLMDSPGLLQRKSVSTFSETTSAAARAPSAVARAQRLIELLFLIHGSKDAS
jgi:hypothetical protein